MPMTLSSDTCVLLTDAPWVDTELEENIFRSAGLEFIRAPAEEETLARLLASVEPAAIITCWALISPGMIHEAEKLRVIARLGAGVDNVAVEAATDRGIWVTNVPDYCVGEVSDHAVALMLAHCRGIVRLDAEVKRTGWRSDGAGLQRVSDLTVGIVGLGRIGSETARKLKAFGCRVIAMARTGSHDSSLAEPVDPDNFARLADVIILHAPLNAETSGMIDTRFLSKCAKRPLLINVSRGGLVDNAALAVALDAGMIGGAALDVVDGEPSPPQSLLNRTDVIITPHVAYASTAAMVELRTRACEEVIRVLRGEQPRNACNTPRVT